MVELILYITPISTRVIIINTSCVEEKKEKVGEGDGERGGGRDPPCLSPPG